MNKLNFVRSLWQHLEEVEKEMGIDVASMRIVFEIPESYLRCVRNEETGEMVWIIKEGNK